LSFDALALHPALRQGLTTLGFEKPTPIQEQAIPPAMTGRDVLACAMTGSGKTAAFLLPILHQIAELPRGTTRALILTPTRELAAQILEDCDDLAKHTRVRAAAVYGGVGMAQQERAFRKGADILIATPGRLLDHFRAPYAKLPGLSFLVLDEADRMLDMGFLPDIRRVLKHIPKQKQTLFFSATMPKPIVHLTHELLRDPVRIALQRKAAPASGVRQAVYPVPQKQKADLLIELLRRGQMQDALVFTRTKHRADRLARSLVKAGIRAERIHGNRSQGQRTQALKGFKDGRYRVLVATDIAARGIDVEALGHVVNFDVPKVPEDYIHRVGRTARAELTGDAFTFVSREEEPELFAIEQEVGKPLPRVTLEGFEYGHPGGPVESPRGGGRPRSSARPRNGHGATASRNGARSAARKGSSKGTRKTARKGALNGFRGGRNGVSNGNAASVKRAGPTGILSIGRGSRGRR
jgi:ATP-dependent RNA helicase RhlE